MTDYQYDTLPDDGCIRTVTIHPGEPHEDVVVSLTCARFDPNRPPPYEALSYVWGSNENPEYIQVANKLSGPSPEGCPGSNHQGTARLPVTQNLAVALRNLRYLDKSRVMWVDAICINQHDNVEKGNQVAKMGDIYSKASLVVVWLGPAQNDSHVAMDVMADLGSQIEVDWHNDIMTSAPGASDPTLGDRNVLLPLKGELWYPIFDLLSRPWFDRLWVRQEIYLATSAVVLCGDKEVPWSFFRAALYCFSFKRRGPSIPESDLFAQQLADRLSLLTGIHSQDPVNIYRLRARFDETQCQDPRDRIFAVRSLVPPNLQALWPLPDYTRPAIDIYEQLTLAYISSWAGDSLDVLAECEFHEGSSGLGTTLATNRRPSWVPDWSVKASGHRKWQGGGCRIGNWHEVAGPGVLRVLGRRKDVVQTVDPIPSFRECRASGVKKPEAVQIYRRILPAIQPDEAYPHGGRLIQAYAHSLINGSIAERRSNKSGGWPLSEVMSDFVEKLISGHQFTLGELEGGELYHKAVCALENYKDKQLFRGTEGYVGMAPLPVRAGDEVWAIVGCKMPIVLRRVDKDRFIVVSECYAEGLADGEGLLGPLPQGIRGVWTPNSKGEWMQGFEDVRTGETFFRDPRMESLGLLQDKTEEKIRDAHISFGYEAEKLMQVIPGLQRIDLV